MKATVTLATYKADQTLDDVPISDAVISITETLPEFPYTEPLERWDEFADAQAKAIEDALIRSLPGSVYDRLLGRMFARKASHFRVAHGE